MTDTISVSQVLVIPCAIVGLPFAAVFWLADTGYKKVCQLTADAYAKVEQLLYEHGYGEAWEIVKYKLKEIATDRVAFYVYQMAERCVEKAIEITKFMLKKWLLEALKQQNLAEIPLD